MKINRFSCLLMALLLLVLTGCAKKAPAEESAAPPPRIDDKTREWYEVFVWSFADSDGDGIGDLNGLTGKLDYIEDLGCNGVWLMPIMPSPSYHKYDVTDYCAVDPQYGTMDDMRALLEAAHSRGIRVIIDLPVNHSSDQHPWFVSAAAGPDAPYRDYYNWNDTSRSGYSEKNGYYYESRFVYSMPDLNLDNPAVREEIESIVRFWLEDVGVDGFRLDAVTSYYTGDVNANVEFLNWLADVTHGVDADSFLVAEAWDSLSNIARYSESRVDSFFLFPVSQNEGYIAKVLGGNNKHPGASLGDYMIMLEETLPENTIPAPFLENHDTGRAVGFTGRSNPAKTKMAGGLLAMMRGGVFVYYGQEIGMAGSGEDPNKRIGMLWTTQEETTAPPPGTTTVAYAYPSVAEQESDPDSLLNYYKAALALRIRFPAISRGTTQILPAGSEAVCLALRTWGEESVLLAVNPSLEAVSCPLEGEAAGYAVLSGSLVTGADPVTLEGATLTLPGYSIAVLTR